MAQGLERGGRIESPRNAIGQATPCFVQRPMGVAQKLRHLTCPLTRPSFGDVRLHAHYRIKQLRPPAPIKGRTRTFRDKDINTFLEQSCLLEGYNVFNPPNSHAPADAHQMPRTSSAGRTLG